MARNQRIRVWVILTALTGLALPAAATCPVALVCQGQGAALCPDAPGASMFLLPGGTDPLDQARRRGACRLVRLTVDGSGPFSLLGQAVDIASGEVVASLDQAGLPEEILAPFLAEAAILLAMAPPQGRLKLTWNGPDAVLHVDGRFVGPVGEALALTLPAGRHDLALVSPADGLAIWSLTTTIEAGLGRPTLVQAQLTPKRKSRFRWMQPLAWVCSGLTLAALGPAVGLGVSASQEEEEYLQAPRVDNIVQMTRAEAQGRADGASELAVQANILYVVAGVAAAAAATLFVLDYTMTED